MRAFFLVPLVLASAACVASVPPRKAEAPRPPPAPTAPVAEEPQPAPTATPEPCDDNAAATQAATPTPTPWAPPSNDDALDDGIEVATPDADANATSPVDSLTDAEIEAKLNADPASLGTISLGTIHNGALVYGIQMPAGKNWTLVSPPQSYGARETVQALQRAIDAVADQFPDTPKAFIGDISRQGGGHFPPHVSHQSGRDVDMSYYLKGDAHRWYATANAKNLDLARSWALVKALVTGSDVDLLLMDRSIQRLLKDYAKSIGEDTAWLDSIFQIDNTSTRPIIIHVPGHASHIHVRFWAAESRELGRRAYPFLMKKHLIKPASYSVSHVVQRGETLSSIAARFHVSVDTIRKANNVPGLRVPRGRTLRIPKSGGVERVLAKIVAPPRRLPPPPPEKAVAMPQPAPAPTPCARASSRTLERSERPVGL